MTRKINLSRIHAINWYGYQDSFPVCGNLLLAGLTGSGKSILMDLIQLVLVGDRRMTRFNQSATGDRSTRDLKGYCLGDIKQEEGGVAQYMRNSAITYVALEFTWPAKEKTETWGLRIEFTSSAENKGRIDPFSCPDALNLDDFCPRGADGRRSPLDHATFKRLIHERAGQLYPEGIERYRRDMASPGHLNYDSEVLGRLLPSAMSFTFLRSFDDFCRQFILPADKLDVSDVTASYRAYKSYEKELLDLEDQLKLLAEIREDFSALTTAQIDSKLCKYLNFETEAASATEQVERFTRELKKLRSEAAEDEKELVRLVGEIEQLDKQRGSFERAMHETPEGRLYARVRSDNKTLVARIEELRQRGRTLDEALALRVRRAKQWRHAVETLPLDWEAAGLAAFDRALSAVESGGSSRAVETLTKLKDSADALLREAQSAAKQGIDQLKDIRAELGREREQLTMLQNGRLPFPTSVLDTLNSELLPLDGKSPACHLRSLCEVKPSAEDWRPAIEVAFTRKFAIVVDARQFSDAVKIYHRMPKRGPDPTFRESLIDPSKALELKRPVKSGSLAEKLETNHPVAGAIISHLFGDLMCVESADELAASGASHAILRDGFMRRGAFLERTRHYDNIPFVGERGLFQQMEWKKKRIAELENDERKLIPRQEALEAVRLAWQSQFEIPADLHRELAETQRLPELERQFEANKLELRTIDRAKFESVEHELNETELLLRQARERKESLISNQKHKEIIQKERDMNAAAETSKLRHEAFDKFRYGQDFSPHISRLEILRRTKLQAFGVLDVAAREFDRDATRLEGEAEKHRAECIGTRRLLVQRHNRFDELPIEAEDNDAYEAQLRKVEGAEIPGYREKAEKERRNWEIFFRQNVLSRLHAALQEVERTRNLLNALLRPHPIGDNRYSITKRENPDFAIYHRLLNAAHAAGEDDLFFRNIEEDLRDAMEQFLLLLTEKSDSAEATRLLDYRCYFDYDMEVRNINDETARPSSVDKHAGKFSGGENQSPYFIAILASYLRAYKRHDSRGRSPSLALVPIDEAFSKLSGERIRDCINALKSFDLQGVFSMSTGNIPYAFDLCDHLLAISKEERKVGTKVRVRNIASSITRDSPEARDFLELEEPGE